MEATYRPLANVIGEEVLRSKILAFGGDPERYIRLLRDFAGRHEGDVAQISRLLGEPARDDARRIAHTLKGAAGSLGLANIQSAAKVLNDTLLTGSNNAEDVTGLVNALDDAMRQIATALDVIPESAIEDAADIVPDNDILNTLLDRLEALLASYDAEANRCLAGNARLFEVLFGEQARILAADIDRFDYEMALDRLKQLRSGLRT